MLDSETGGASTAGFTYSSQYGIRRASTRPDVYRTQFGSISADDYLAPMIQQFPKVDSNVARRLSRNSFLIPRQTMVRRATSVDGMTSLFPLLIFLLPCFRPATSRLTFPSMKSGQASQDLCVSAVEESDGRRNNRVSHIDRISRDRKCALFVNSEGNHRCRQTCVHHFSH